MVIKVGVIGLFTDRLAIEKPERSSEEVKNILQAKLTTLIASS